MEELKSIDESSAANNSEPTPTPVSLAPTRVPRDRRAESASKQSRKPSEDDIKGREERRWRSEAREKERQIAHEEMRNMQAEARQREVQYKNKVRDEIRAKEEKAREEARQAWKVARDAAMEAETKAREARQKRIREEPPPVADMPHTDFEAIFTSIRVKPVSETVKEEIEAIQASHSSSSSPETVDSLIAARIQNMRERAGDYSRFLPSHLGVGRSPEHQKSVGGPVAYAELNMTRLRGAGLRKRLEAVKVVERLVKTRSELKDVP
jgi:hypothetical protein